MISRVRSYFKEAKLARMSDGTLCLVRDLGPVKGGKGMKHHETLMAFSVRGLLAGLHPSRPSAAWSAPEPELRANSSSRL
jgi:hypothetical protein